MPNKEDGLWQITYKGTHPTYGHYYDMVHVKTGLRLTEALSGCGGGYVYIYNFFNGDKSSWNSCMVVSVNNPVLILDRMNWTDQNCWNPFGGTLYPAPGQGYNWKPWWKYQGTQASISNAIDWVLERQYASVSNIETFDGTGIDTTKCESYYRMFFRSLRRHL